MQLFRRTSPADLGAEQTGVACPQCRLTHWAVRTRANIPQLYVITSGAPGAYEGEPFCWIHGAPRVGGTRDASAIQQAARTARSRYENIRQVAALWDTVMNEARRAEDERGTAASAALILATLARRAALQDAPVIGDDVPLEEAHNDTSHRTFAALQFLASTRFLSFSVEHAALADRLTGAELAYPGTGRPQPWKDVEDHAGRSYHVHGLHQASARVLAARKVREALLDAEGGLSAEQAAYLDSTEFLTYAYTGG